MAELRDHIFIDDKSAVVVPFILNLWAEYSTTNATKPFIVGLNGVQGVGKTILVKSLARTLEEDAGLRTLVVSIDDFYLRREDQEALAASDPDNKLVQVRGQPGTHDIKLLQDFFMTLLNSEPTRVPQYNKAAHSGQGDREPQQHWVEVNSTGEREVQVVLFEGWCVGFRPLVASEIEARRRAPSTTLQYHKLEHLQSINNKLADYGAITDMFDVFVHVDAENTKFVYAWRLQQERALQEIRGTGMTDEEVVSFVDAYYPAYELYLDALRKGLFREKQGRHLRLAVDGDQKSY